MRHDNRFHLAGGIVAVRSWLYLTFRYPPADLLSICPRTSGTFMVPRPRRGYLSFKLAPVQPET